MNYAGHPKSQLQCGEKGAKKGKYVITVTAAATKNHKAAKKTITITVK